MTKATINNLEEAEKSRNYIIHLLKQLTIDYQNTKQERKDISLNVPIFEEEFSVIEEIELLTTTIRGYASQIQVQGYIKPEKEAIIHLQAIRVLDIPVITQFYNQTDENYKQIKAYLQKLDYLRLLILEYLNTYEI